MGWAYAQRPLPVEEVKNSHDLCPSELVKALGLQDCPQKTSEVVCLWWKGVTSETGI
jgi:hypothetical protein